MTHEDIDRITARLIEGLRPIVEREAREVAQREVTRWLREQAPPVPEEHRPVAPASKKKPTARKKVRR